MENLDKIPLLYFKNSEDWKIKYIINLNDSCLVGFLNVNNLVYERNISRSLLTKVFGTTNIENINKKPLNELEGFGITEEMYRQYLK